ncbi:MAG: hypothetical protein JXA90_01305 [Planctomycetes bacterium]|nr:hypothetical protein [Planctomycetota bacterium]
MLTRKKILAFGETLWDLFPTGAVLGGAPFNFVYRVSSLGDEGRIASRIGKDELGLRVLDALDDMAMDALLVQIDPEYPTGTVGITLDEARNPVFTIHRDVAYDRIVPTEELLAAAADVDCICFGTLVQRGQVSRQTLATVLHRIGPDRETIRLLDINLRRGCYSERSVRWSLERANILKLNDSEAREIAGMLDIREPALPDICRRLIDRWSLSACLLTLGERGAFAASRDGQAIYDPGYRVDVVDTCGSGDAFAAGFIHLHLQGEPLDACCRMGNALGTLVATTEGATEGIFQRDVKELFESPPERIEDPEFRAFRRD